MGRSPCCDKASVKRGPWSQEEDAILRSFVERFGNAGNWIALPQKAGLRRCGKSCRLRWLNYLRPALRHGGFTDEEDHLILSLYGEIGSKWSVIASRLPGRTDNDVKNYWNTKLKKMYLATTRETPPPPPPAGGDSIAAANSPSESDQSTPPPPPTPVLVNLNTALDTVDDDDELLHKSEQLYAELMELIEQQSTTTTSPPAVEASVATSSSSSPLGTSPTASSAGSSMWPLDVHDTILLSESSSSSSSLFEFDHPYGSHAFGVDQLPDTFQDLLGSSYDDEVIVTKELPYY